MKKINLNKKRVGALCIGAFIAIQGAAMAVPASAAEQAVVPGPDYPYQSPDMTGEQEAQVGSDYISIMGVITEITKDGDYYSILVGDMQSGTIFMSDGSDFVFDAVTGEHNSVAELEVGMNVEAILYKYSPMTMSIPGQTSGAIGFIIKSEDDTVAVDLFNSELTDTENTLQLNISDDTEIKLLDDETGMIAIGDDEQLLTAEDLKNKQLVVVYGSSTRSIPAQATPDAVIVLPEYTEEAVTETDNQEGTDAYVPLRAEAEAKGYAVEWISMDDPIVITKDDMRIEISIGSSEFVFTHNTKDVKPLDTMEKMELDAVIEGENTMVAQSFIDALV